jgi:hypothetical protein
MNRIEEVHAVEESQVQQEDDQGWDWLIVLPVLALGLLAYQISEAAMTSVFDEEEE